MAARWVSLTRIGFKTGRARLLPSPRRGKSRFGRSITFPNDGFEMRSRWIVTGVLLGLLLGGVNTSAAEPARSALPDAFSPDQLLWEREFGDHQYTVPVVDQGRLFVGINDSALQHPLVQPSGGGVLLCLDRVTGERIWQLPIPRYMQGTEAPFHFNHWRCGVCSSPAVAGDRLYLVGPRGDVLCLDANGQRDGNAGPFLDEIRYMGAPAGPPDRLTQQDGDIVWRFDLIEKLGVVPHDVCGSSPTLLGDYLYVCTSNGVDDTHRNVANPSAPSLIVLNRHTGKLVAVEDAGISARTLHGQWSSPRVVHVEGRAVVLYGGGDGVLYALEPFAGDEQDVQVLRQVWQYDCCPPDYRQRDGQPIPYARWNQKSEDGPSEIIATPVSDEHGKVYVAIGQSPLHGPGRGMLSCIDGASGSCLWQSRAVDRTLSNIALEGGLLYAADYSGRLHCFDAETGEILWQHDLESGVWCASPVVADGKVYISTEKKLLWVLRAGREKQVLARSRLRSEAITPVVAEDVLYLPTQKRLFAVKLR